MKQVISNDISSKSGEIIYAVQEISKYIPKKDTEKLCKKVIWELNLILENLKINLDINKRKGIY